ncbi:hypothetical protein LEP1GSC059_2028 [Leptospira noguchii serovar Panama str. CZ214]|uniref:Uncharacterized protein n=1 Tax=Leptospira noguchii serovar Panama str. CZ214 TaxID=1001595 RepID=T0F9Y7_9LEPT|nr:hypothetical protein LEP1GSC059_2028 [Leptospira noguchii serovar Panama str. CZ214]
MWKICEFKRSASIFYNKMQLEKEIETFLKTEFQFKTKIKGFTVDLNLQ